MITAAFFTVPPIFVAVAFWHIRESWREYLSYRKKP